MMLKTLLRLTLFVLCTVVPVQAQTFRLGEPLALTANGNGWAVAPNTGALQFSFPVLTMAGDMPVQVAFRMNGSFSAAKPQPTAYWNEQTQTYEVFFRTVARPVYGTATFGYIAGGGNDDGSSEGVSAAVLAEESAGPG